MLSHHSSNGDSTCLAPNCIDIEKLGAKHVESPFIEFGQISTVLYFAHFLVIVPVVSLIENSLVDLHLQENVKNINN